MTLPIVDVEIENDVFIKCPITEPAWKHIRATKCRDCPHFSGIGALAWADSEEDKKKIDSLQWSQKYAIRCSAPIEYRTMQIDL
jgi:formate dehydrogenase maturation protein FdhE